MGTVSPTDKRSVATELFAKIPVLGRVKLASLAGNLRGDPKDVRAQIDACISKGEATLILEDILKFSTSPRRSMSSFWETARQASINC